MKLAALSLTTICLISFSSEASAKFHMIDDLPVSSKGVCLGLPSSQGGIEETTRMRIKGVQQRLRDLKVDARLLDPLKFTIVSRGHSNQYGGSRLTLSTACMDGDSISNCPVGTGTVAHEIGHWIGASMDIRGRNAYQSFVDSGAYKKCHGFDGYSTHFRTGRAHNNDLHETFAEVFAGYVVNPNVMKDACPAGYEFMKEQVFRGELSACPLPESKKPKKDAIPLPRPRPAIPESKPDVKPESKPEVKPESKPEMPAPSPAVSGGSTDSLDDAPPVRPEPVPLPRPRPAIKAAEAAKPAPKTPPKPSKKIIPEVFRETQF